MSNSRYLRLQPIFPYFLRSRLNTADEELKRAIETAFREYYDGNSAFLTTCSNSKKAQDKIFAEQLISIEYENLITALKLALAAKASILNPYMALSYYIDFNKNYRYGLELGHMIMKQLKTYPDEILLRDFGLEIVSVCDNIAKYFEELKQLKESESIYEKNLDLIEKINIDDETRKKLIRSTYHQLGIIAQQKQEWRKAEDYYEESLKINIAIPDLCSIAGDYYQLGVLAYEQRLFQKAEYCFQQALDIYISLKDKLGQARVYHIIGILLYQQKNYEKIGYYYQKALDIFIEFNDKKEIAQLYHNLGTAEYARLQQQKAETYYQQALKNKIELNDQYGQASTYTQLGSVAKKQRQLEQAREYYLKALRIYIEYKDEYNLGVVLHNLSRLYSESQDAALPASVACVLGISAEEAGKMLTQSIRQ